MSGTTGNNGVPENGLATKIENLSVVSSGEQQPLPTSPGSLSETKDSNNQDELLAAAERSLLQKVIRKGLIENKNDLEIQRKDPKSPLYSVKSFEALNLRPQLLKGVYSMGKHWNYPMKNSEIPNLVNILSFSKMEYVLHNY